MAGIVRLRQVRKQRARIRKRAQASENAVKFGRTKAERAADQARREKAERTLSAHRRDEE